MTQSEPLKHARLDRILRDEIIRGVYGPEQRLPSRAELGARHRVGQATVQKALDALRRDGFVEARKRAGTFVAENPPHLSHYGLVFGYRPEDPSSWSGLARTMRDAALAIDRSEGRRLSIFFHSGYARRTTEHFERLVSEVVSHTVAGLIFVESPHRLIDTPVIQQPGIPRVGIMSEAIIPGVAAVYVDQNGFFDRALDDLRARGRRRIAIISREYPKTLQDYVRSGAASREFELRPYWWHSANADGDDWAKNTAHLLLHDPKDRPDALIVGDEMYVNAASAGIAASGAIVGRDLDVIAHCNFPQLPAKVLPIRLLGFDAERLLRTCIEYIDRVRQGESTPDVTLIPAQFEEELTRSRADVGAVHLTEVSARA